MTALNAEQLREIAGESVGSVEAVEPLAGDASSRRFFRVRTVSAKPVVAMVFDGAIDALAHPQLRVGSYLESRGFPVPRLIAARPEFGVLFYEDLGDRLLQDLVRPGAGPSLAIEHGGETERLYVEAVRLIADLQSRGTEGLPPGHPALAAALDEERFVFELRFFREHYLEGLRELRFGAREADTLERFFGALARDASARPWVLCHRDFHARNLLVHEGRIRLVDFQDARMGPLAYDLASLLRDSYAVLPAELRSRLLGVYLDASRELVPDAEWFRHQFDIVALQRNLKAIGTFGYQTVVRRKTVYLPHIGPTWEYIFDTLSRLPVYSDVVPILELAALGT